MKKSTRTISKTESLAGATDAAMAKLFFGPGHRYMSEAEGGEETLGRLMRVSDGRVSRGAVLALIAGAAAPLGRGRRGSHRSEIIAIERAFPELRLPAGHHYFLGDTGEDKNTTA